MAIYRWSGHHRVAVSRLRRLSRKLTHGSPGVLTWVGGEGKVTREGQTQTMTPGTTLKLKPYDVQRLVASGNQQFQALWIRWAPNGDRSGYKRPVYLLEALPQHTASARLAEEVHFH